MVKPGYKQTEIGAIPEEWKVVSIGDIAVFQGGSQPPIHYFSSQEQEGYIRLVQIRDYKTDKYLTYIPENLAKRFCTKEDIMIGRYGPPIFQILRGIAGAYNVALIKAIPRNVNRDYLYYVLKNDQLYEYIELLSRRSSGQTGVDLNGLREYRIGLPSDSDQRKMADALADCDKLISNLEKLVSKKKAIKQGAMQELLTGKKRLPGYATPWVSRKLCDIAPLQRGFDLPYSQLEDGPIPVVFSNGINAHHRVAMVKGPGVITGRSGTIGKLHYVDGDYWPHNTTLWVTDFKGNNPRFVYYLFHLVNWTDYMTGSGVPTLNRNDVHEKVISIPGDVEEQESIAVVLSEVDSEITALEEKLDKYRRVKQGMMQQLLTGKTRLV